MAKKKVAEPRIVEAENKTYELMLVLKPDLLESSVTKKLKEFTKFLKDNECDVTMEDIWGKRKLAYKIKQYEEGNYVVYNLVAPTTFIKEIDNHLRIDNDVIRHLLVSIDSDYKYSKFDEEVEPARPAGGEAPKEEKKPAKKETKVIKEEPKKEVVEEKKEEKEEIVEEKEDKPLDEATPKIEAKEDEAKTKEVVKEEEKVEDIPQDSTEQTDEVTEDSTEKVTEEKEEEKPKKKSILSKILKKDIPLSDTEQEGKVTKDIPKDDTEQTDEVTKDDKEAKEEEPKEEPKEEKDDEKEEKKKKEEIDRSALDSKLDDLLSGDDLNI